MRIGAIEAGGTKMVCALTDEDGTLLERETIPTRAPDETVPAMAEYMKKWKVEALGIGCFGPLDLNKNSATYGCITKTPKTAWADYPMVRAFSEALHIPVGFDTDVNAAVLGEVVWGAARGCSSAVYMTVGTGIGVGVYANGELLHGLVHPEAGHMLVARHASDEFPGCCPFHACCLEGMAGGPAIEQRWGKPARELSQNDKVWELEAWYLSQAVANEILLYSPEKIILWGGVMHQAQLFPMIRKNVVSMLAGYVHHPMIEEHIDDYIVPPALGENPGILGAAYLGLSAYREQKS